MRIVTQFRLFVATMLLLTLASAITSVWTMRMTLREFERIQLAEIVFEGLLSLESKTYQLFKQYGDALILDNADRRGGAAELMGQVREDIARVRSAIGAEIAAVGGEEIVELHELGRIEGKIEELNLALERLSRRDTTETVSADWLEVSRILEGEIDQDFRAMMAAALGEEQREVEETRAEVAQQMRQFERVSIVFAFLAIILAGVSVWAIGRLVDQPFCALMEGVSAFADGKLDRRIVVRGARDIVDIGVTFNMLADRIRAQTEALVSEKTSLAEAVSVRTQQLEVVLADLRRAEANRRRLLADVSHELRTPLTIIRGEAEIALRAPSRNPEALTEALMRVRDAAAHTARIVDDLLFVARSEAGELRLNPAEMDLRQVVEEVLATFSSDVPFLTDVDAAPMRGDSLRIKQAVLILLENARRHGGQSIIVRLNHGPGTYRVAVEDDGPGMSEAEKDHAFERLYRGANAMAFHTDGLGLGLPVAQRIVAAHGGTIVLADRPGGGLIATLDVPIKPLLKAIA
ncbi:MAG: HAMP domain-containing sensor histidine kinase [Defluviicoccus sp.]